MIIAQLTGRAAQTKAIKEQTAALNANTIAQKANQVAQMDVANKEAILVVLQGLNKENQFATLIQAGYTDQMIASTLATETYTEAMALEELQAYKLSVANGAVNKSIWANIKAMAIWMATNPVGWFIAIAGAIGIAVASLATYQKWLNNETERSQKSFDKAKESAKKYTDQLKTLREETNKASKFANEIADEYAKLSQGIDSLTNENLSLTNTDYARFLELNNQLVDLFPTLTKGYDENGNAILGLSGDVDTVTSSIKALAEQQKELSKAQIVKDLKNYVDGENGKGGQLKAVQEKQNQYNIKSNMLSRVNDIGELINDPNKERSDIDGDILKEFLNIAGYNIDDVWNGIGYNFGAFYTDGSETDLKNLKSAFNDFRKEYSSQVTLTENELKNENDELSSTLMYWIEDLDIYKDNPSLRNPISMMMKNIDFGSSEFDGMNYDEIKKYIYRTILNPIQDACENPENKEELEKAFQDIFSVDLSKLTIQKKSKFVSNNSKILSRLLGIDENEVRKNFFGDANKEVTTYMNLYKDYMNKASQLYSDYYNSRTKLKNELESYNGSDTINFAERPVIDTQKLIDKGWGEKDPSLSAGDTATVYSSAFSNEDETKTVVVTPILPDGSVLTPQELENYAQKLLDGETIDADIKMAMFEGKDSIKQADDFSEKIHDLHQDYFDKHPIDFMKYLNGIEKGFTSINQLDILNKIIQNANSVEEVIERIKIAFFKPNAQKTVFEDLFDVKFIDETKQKLLDLSTAGELSVDVINSTEEYKALLDELGISAEEFVNKINEFNLDYLNEQYEYLIQLLERVRNGESLTFEEMTFLISKHSELASAVKITSEGYSLEEDAVINLANQLASTSNQAISNQVQLTKRTLEEVEKRIKAYELENQYLLDSGIGTALTKTGRNYDKLSSQYGYTKDQVDKYLSYIKSKAKRLNLKQELQDLLSELDEGLKSEIPSGSSSSSDSEETFDWIETAIQRLERQITNLGKTASAAYKSWEERNESVLKQLGLTRHEIELQQAAYERYMQAANAVGLSDDFINKIQNGAMDIDKITDDALKKKIQEYTEWYEKALGALDAIQDLRDAIASLVKTNFDNVAQEFDNYMDLSQFNADMYQGYIDMATTAGGLASKQYYEALISGEEDVIGALKKQQTALTQVLQEGLDNGTIEVFSESWYEMQSKINDVRKSILDANTSLIEFQNSMRQLDWDVFDKIEEYAQNIQAESDFMIKLLSYNPLNDKETGLPIDDGMAVAGLHAVNYNAYMSQADEYAKEIKKINAELAKDPSNNILLDRRKELLESQRDLISSAEEEKQAIKDLISESYNAMLEALQKLIDKRKDALKSEKDLYDYQKSVAEQTKKIAAYQKQLEAYSGDVSEETQAKVQQIKVSLEEAQNDLRDTEYDKWLSDQENMLDKLYSDVEDLLNSRLDDINGLLQGIIDQTNANSENIMNTITDAASEVGYSITDSLADVFNSDNGISKVVSMYGDNFTTYSTGVQSSLNNIRDLIQKMVDIANASAPGNISSVIDGVLPTEGSIGANGGFDYGSTQNYNSTPTTNTQPVANNDFFIPKPSGNKSGLNTESSVVDRLKSLDKDASMGARAQYYASMGFSGTYTGSASQNNQMLQWMKSNGFKKGGTIGNLVKSSGEDGFVLARSGEEILSLEKIKELGSAFKNMTPIMDSVRNFNGYIPRGNNGNVNNGDISVNINLPNVTDYNSFVTQLQTDKRFEKIVQQMTIGNALGGNSLTKLKF